MDDFWGFNPGVFIGKKTWMKKPFNTAMSFIILGERYYDVFGGINVALKTFQRNLAAFCLVSIGI